MNINTTISVLNKSQAVSDSGRDPKLIENDFVYADGLCDDELNTPECGYDGGDCCTHKKDDWDALCKDCQCHTEEENFGCDDYDKDWFQDGECDAALNNPE